MKVKSQYTKAEPNAYFSVIVELVTYLKKYREYSCKCQVLFQKHRNLFFKIPTL